MVIVLIVNVLLKRLDAPKCYDKVPTCTIILVVLCNEWNQT